MAGIPIPTIRELEDLLDDDTYKIYEDGLTCTINQADSDYGTECVKRYKPKSVAEMAAFVAVIRPGCASLLQDFLDRKPYTTGVDELDELLVEGSHRMLFQELIMKYLIWLGIPETGSYDIIKKISKKKFKEPELEDLKFKLEKGWIKKVGNTELFISTWTVVEQAAHYSFNSAHALSYGYDSLYGAYLKSHYPLEYYTVAMNYYVGDNERTLKLTNELSYFDISLKPIKFRFSQGKYSPSREDNSIYKGIASIKYMNSLVADELYALRNNNYDGFMDLLYDIKEKTSTNSRQLRILIDLDFFSEFGDANYLITLTSAFDDFGGKKQIKKEKIESSGIDINLVRKFAGKETEKMFTNVDTAAMLRHIKPKYTMRSLKERVAAQVEHLGYIDIVGDEYQGIAATLDVDTKYSPRLKMYSLKNGTIVDCKVDKRTFNKTRIKKGDLIKIQGQTKKLRQKRMEDGSFEPIPGVFDVWITKYTII